MFLNDVFLFSLKWKVCNHAGDNSLYESGKKMEKVKNDLEMYFKILNMSFHERFFYNPWNYDRW